MMEIAEGRIGESKRRIDACLWFDANSERMQGAVINLVDAIRVQRVCSLLQFDPIKIKS
jgi:hypothetical protein